jgi:hypothetical protein
LSGGDRVPLTGRQILVCFAALGGFLSCDDLGDALTLDLLHAKEVAVEVDLVSNLGGAAYNAKDEAADGVEVLALELGA